ncbi:hypothetical protein MTBUT4_70032 [Magnetospirillum sp. UT-4]|nr:hypothetical protein MTBUT4_70032 [Magnetospirillum sp. UT-4]
MPPRPPAGEGGERQRAGVRAARVHAPKTWRNQRFRCREAHLTARALSLPSLARRVPPSPAGGRG